MELRSDTSARLSFFMLTLSTVILECGGFSGPIVNSFPYGRKPAQVPLGGVRRQAAVRVQMSWRLPKGYRREDVAGGDMDPSFASILGNRLGIIASLVNNGSCVLDVGTDHGYLPIALMKSGKALKVIASDKNILPLDNARQSLERINDEALEQLELRLGDGLAVLSCGEVDTVTVSGVGGKVISEILFGAEGDAGEVSERRRVQDYGVRRVVLQPTGSISTLRKDLLMNGWEIVDEIINSEAGWIYITMVAEWRTNENQGENNISAERMLVGPHLLRRASNSAAEKILLREWIKHQLRHFKSRRDGMRMSSEDVDQLKLEEAEENVKILSQVLGVMEGPENGIQAVNDCSSSLHLSS